MGILGKLLLVVNLLIGGGFAYLAVQDWKGRQTIAAGALRHVIFLQGLPLGDRQGDPLDMPNDPEAEIPFRVVMAGGAPTETVSPGLLKAYFAAAGGGGPGGAEGQAPLASSAPVPNQLAEVKRVYALIKGEIEKRDGAREKAVVAGPWLLLQAETVEERAEVQALIAAGNGDALAQRLYRKFEQVLNPPKAPDTSAISLAENADGAAVNEHLKKVAELRTGAVKDETERRARIAHLLVLLDPNPNWQKRALLVVGIRQYVRTLADQALRVRDMTARVQQGVVDDQAKFETEYATLRNRAIDLTERARDKAEVRGRVETQRQKDADFVEQLKTQLASLKDQLAKTKADVGVLLAQQTVTEQQLFGVQQEVGLTLEEIYQLESELAKKERERYGR